MQICPSRWVTIPNFGGGNGDDDRAVRRLTSWRFTSTLPGRASRGRRMGLVTFGHFQLIAHYGDFERRTRLQNTTIGQAPECQGGYVEPATSSRRHAGCCGVHRVRQTREISDEMCIGACASADAPKQFGYLLGL
jgi:hypothetical protein